MTMDRCRIARWVARGFRLGVTTGSGALLLLGGVERSEAYQAETPSRKGLIRFYSTAAPPLDYPGPTPEELESDRPQVDRRAQTATSVALADPPANDERQDEGANPRDGLEPAGEVEPDPSRLARNRPADRVPDLTRPRAESSLADGVSSFAGEPDPIALAMATLTECKARYERVEDYTCTFIKRERINGRLSNHEVMLMKARTRPHSVYFKFKQPNAGREAIFVQGRNDNMAIVHDVGIGRLLAGTVRLAPRSRRAMEGNRHPITEAGIGFMIDTLLEGWRREMTPQDSVVTVRDGVLVNRRPVTLIVCTHPERDRRFVYHEVRVYIDQELGLPIRFEAYDWPRRPGEPAPLLEEYTYTNLRLNVGLTDHDFDPSNKTYSFGRF